MAVRRLAPPEQQPKDFAFTAENAAWAKQQIAKYPPGRQQSAIIPLLWRAQEQNGGWLPEAAIRHVADLLDMAAHPRPGSRDLLHHVPAASRAGRRRTSRSAARRHACCAARKRSLDVCRKRIHHDPLHVSADGDFSWEEVECLGACVNAPMVLIWSDTYEDLTAESFRQGARRVRRRTKPKPGPQIDRQLSAPIGGPQPR